MAAPEIIAGAAIAYRLFDIADTIDLTQVETLWSRRAQGQAARGRFTVTPAKAVAFGVPPVVLGLGELALTLGEREVRAGLTARVFDFGVVSLALRVGLERLDWSEFCRQLNLLDRSVGPDGTAPPWHALLERLRGVIGPALTRPSVRTLEEDYLIGVLRVVEGRPSAAELVERIDLVPLLAGEARPLSEPARAELLRQRFSYYTDDLAVLTWDRAFVYEPRGESDVIDVIEVANAQLLEMRYYDELLDDELPRMNDLVDSTRRGTALFSARRYAGLARRLYMLVAEVTELTEKVDNALQVTEDVYLARIYSAALDLFRVPSVNAAVARKLAIIRDTYEALYAEAASSRAELLEVLIIILIAAEIVLALIRH